MSRAFWGPCGAMAVDQNDTVVIRRKNEMFVYDLFTFSRDGERRIKVKERNFRVDDDMMNKINIRGI